MNLYRLVSVGIVSLSIAAAGAQTMYSPVIVGCNTSGLASPVLATAIAVNASGQVTGQVLIGTTPGAMLWQNGVATDITPAQIGNGKAINAAGQVAASVVTQVPSLPRKPGYNLYQSFVIGSGLDRQVGPSAVGVSYPTGINSLGHVVGSAPNFAWLDEYNGSYKILPTLGGTQTYAAGINDSDQVVGYSTLPGGTLVFLPTLWQGRTITNLGLLPGDTSGGATAINNSGQIVGYTYQNTQDGTLEHAFLWQGGAMTDISSDYSFISASSINNQGIIVGSYKDPGGVNRAFVREGTAVVDLNTRLTAPLPSGLLANGALSINDTGAILIDAFVVNSNEGCYFLLQPVS